MLAMKTQHLLISSYLEQAAQAKQLDKAVLCYEHVLAIDPDHVTALHLLALARIEQRCWPQALELLNKAIALSPSEKSFYYHRAQVCFEVKQFYQAANDYQQVLSMEKPSAEIILALVRAYEGITQLTRLCGAFLLLLLGNYREGWEAFEERYNAGANPPLNPDIYHSLWQNQDLAHRCLLVHCEDGHGDAFQFIRYLPLLKARGALIIVQTYPELIPFLKSLPGFCVSKWVTLAEKPPKFDYYIPLMSLPHRFQTELSTIPPVKIFKIKSSQTHQLSSTDKLLRVGLVWAGSPRHINDHVRSMPLGALEPLFSCSNVAFYSLQCGARSQDIQTLGWQNRLVDLAPRIKSWEDTAKFLLNLDLLITVDTGIAHLSASMARPTWVMLPGCCEFRWLLDREDSPWYPSIRLFRQQQLGDWSSVVTAVKSALSPLIDS